MSAGMGCVGVMGGRRRSGVRLDSLDRFVQPLFDVIDRHRRTDFGMPVKISVASTTGQQPNAQQNEETPHVILCSLQ